MAPLEPSFGGINLEDIKAPECFEIEEALRERMNIPVFHDDQHGTAIIVAAAVINAMRLVGKDIAKVKIATSGAGAAAIACMNMLIAVGAKQGKHLDRRQQGPSDQEARQFVDRWRGAFAQDTDKTELSRSHGRGRYLCRPFPPRRAEARDDGEDGAQSADPGALQPNPEIMPELAKATRPDALVCTGRSDYPNQVNNVLCFPFLFRGALDCGATVINEEMKAAAAHAIARLAHEPGLEATTHGVPAIFGPDYLIPNPFDQRLILRIAPGRRPGGHG